MDIRVLGTLTVTVDGRAVAPGGPRCRDVLALLVQRRGEAVSADRLIDLLSAADGPVATLNAVQVAVSRLRSRLGRELIGTGSGGYRLDPAAVHVDEDRFRALVADGRAARQAGAPERASTLLRQALELWQGEAYGGVSDGVAAGERVRLEEERVVALEERIAADLDSGRHAAVAGELRALVARHPLRERLHALLITARYRAGRPAEALQAYHDLRATLGEELGVDPSPELEALQRDVLRHADGLAAPAPAATARRGALPSPLTPTVGRAADLHVLAGTDARLVTVVGPGGVGKTRLLLELGRARAGAGEPVAYADLTGAGPADVADTVARALAVPLTADDPVADLAAGVGGDPLRLLVDNAEHVRDEAAALVGGLLARCPALTAVVASREPLGLVAEREYPLAPLAVPEPGADPWEVLDSPAVQLLTARIADRVPGFSCGPAEAAVLGAICRRVDGLPLALELAAGHARLLSLDELLDRLADPLELRGPATADRPERHRSLTDTIAWSHARCGPAERAAFARLAVFSGGCTVPAALAVLDGDGEATLGDLVRRSLVTVDRGAGPVRLRMLATIRAYAAAQLDAGGDRPTAQARHRRWYATRRPDQSWVDDALVAEVAADYDNYLAALRSALDGPAAEVFPLARTLGLYWGWTAGVATGLRHLGEVLDRVDPADPRTAPLLVLRGMLLRLTGDPAGAGRDAHAALAGLRRAGSPGWLTAAYGLLAAIDSDTGDFPAAVRWGRRAVAAARDLPADRLAEALSYAAYTCAAAGLTAEAARHAEDAAALTPRMPSLSRRLPVLANAGQTLVECGETARARAVLDRGLAEAVESGEQLPTYAVPCGWLAVAERDWPAATAAFGGYLAGPEATEQPVWAVEALLGAACALARTGDRPVAATVLAGATTAALAMGMVLTPWTAARIAEARELCGPAGPAPDDLASLTALVTRRAHGVVAAATD